MIRFSANLGFLWTDRALPDAIHAARAAGFDAVECHMPYSVPAEEVARALSETGLDMISLNTRIGTGTGDLGVAAVPGREAEARSYIDEAVEYAAAIGCGNVSFVAGRTGKTVEAEVTYRSNLSIAASLAAEHGLQVLIEPLNTRVAADYHLTNVSDGIATIDAVAMPNLKLMVDCFHTQIMDGDLTHLFETSLSYVGHIQIAAVPDRGEPDAGEINYPWLLPRLEQLGYSGPFGAEYTPRTTVEDGLGWLDRYRSGHVSNDNNEERTR